MLKKLSGKPSCLIDVVADCPVTALARSPQPATFSGSCGIQGRGIDQCSDSDQEASAGG
jgi:hypothetical protein